MATETIADQSFESIVPEKEPLEEGSYLSLGKFKIKLKTIYWMAGGVSGFLILLLVFASFFRHPGPPVPPPTPTPTSTPTPIEEKIASPSAYATDSAILRVEADLGIIEEKLQSTDLREASLNPPVLDMDINFEE